MRTTSINPVGFDTRHANRVYLSSFYNVGRLSSLWMFLDYSQRVFRLIDNLQLNWSQGLILAVFMTSFRTVLTHNLSIHHRPLTVSSIGICLLILAYTFTCR